jgi:2-(1,2-epoxy-1,2-dihydrophenyl)acetyl-CoA isomerase
MVLDGQFGDVTVEVGDNHVATVELHRPPNNFFDVDLIRSISTAYEALDADERCRSIVLCSEGKHFCAGADFSGATAQGESRSRAEGEGVESELYREALRLFATRKPVVAAVQGAAVGGGLGVACSADFRVACPEASFWANFVKLGFHHGFGLSVTLPNIIGQQRASDLLLRARRVRGEEAARIGLCDVLVDQRELRQGAIGLAAELAAAAPLAIISIRQTIRADLVRRVRHEIEREASEQQRLRRTTDWREGIRAAAERREPRFTGH